MSNDERNISISEYANDPLRDEEYERARQAALGRVRCSECGATDAPLEYGMCAECCEVDGAFGYQPPIVRTRRMIDYAKYEAAQAEITVLRAALDQERTKVEKLREAAQHIHASRTPMHRDRLNFVFRSFGLLDTNNNPTALLSGRGEGNGNG